MSNTLDVSVAVISASSKHVDRKMEWSIKGRIVKILSDHPKLSAEQDRWMSVLKILGMPLSIEYKGPMLPKLSIRTGILFRLSISKEEIGQALEQIANGEEPSLSLTPEIIRPMAEPCVRVPLSVLKELRGQEAGVEYSRRALVRTWAKDRQTGKKAVGS